MPSELQKARLHFKPKIPKLLELVSQISVTPSDEKMHALPQIEAAFPKIFQQPYLKIGAGGKGSHRPLAVGVVLSGGQAPGGHNVISGLYDTLKALNPASSLLGFLGGPGGIVDDKTIEITDTLVSKYRNMGGFDIIGAGRTKIETPEQFKKAVAAVKKHKLDGLVVIGGDDSNTNAAFLADYFLSNGCTTRVVGVPKTIDGDLKSKEIEISFGFDTAAKTYAATIGSLMRDALSAKKYYYFVKLMGRSASHLALECALQTQPNITLISEEVDAEKKTLSSIVESIADIICRRAEKGKDFGVVLIPEGLVEFIPEVKVLIQELNAALAEDKGHSAELDKIVGSEGKIAYAAKLLSKAAKSCFDNLPKEIQAQLLIGRDAHGNVQVSKIETERMLIAMVKKELKARKEKGAYNGKFDPQPLFCGYEGRSCMPTNFDSAYCYALGRVAAILIDSGATGYICSVGNLTAPVANWTAGGIPLTTLMAIEKRHGEDRPVIQKALVDLKGKPFLTFKSHRDKWAMDDEYVDPGPIQYYGPDEVSEVITKTLMLEGS